MKLLIMQFPPISRHIIPLRSKYSLLFSNTNGYRYIYLLAERLLDSQRDSAELSLLCIRPLFSTYMKQSMVQSVRSDN
jgi:hypothetical protein